MMTREEMQRLLDLLARNGLEEREAVQGLLQVIGIRYNRALKPGEDSDSEKAD